MQTEARQHLETLATTIARRDRPLGVGLKRQCWAGVAHAIAASHGARVTDYFGLSFAEMKAAIKGNNDTDPGRRNDVMIAWTRSLAATRA